jgi:arginase
VHAGCRSNDEHLDEASNTLALILTAPQIRERGAQAVAKSILEVLGRSPLAGFWIHLDLDILDPTVMSSVDSPDPDGLSAEELSALLSVLAPRATGADITIFDPDLDPDGTDAHLVTDLLTDSFGRLGATSSHTHR